MSTMLKADLIAKLHTVLNNFVFGIALRCCFPEERWPKLAGEQLPFGDGTGEQAFVKLAPLVERIGNVGDRQQLYEEYEKSLKRSLLREGHEVLRAYCESTNQLAAYEAEPWFQFARIIRNVVSHEDGGILKRWPPKITGPVTWRSRTLEHSMVGQPVPFTPGEALRLFEDQMAFANKLA